MISEVFLDKKFLILYDRTLVTSISIMIYFFCAKKNPDINYIEL